MRTGMMAALVAASLAVADQRVTAAEQNAAVDPSAAVESPPVAKAKDGGPEIDAAIARLRELGAFVREFHPRDHPEYWVQIISTGLGAETRKTAENFDDAALRDVQQRLRRERRALALTGSGDLIWDWDVSADKVFTSPETESLLGLKRGTLEGPAAKWLEVLHPLDQDRFRAALDSVLDQRRGRLVQDFRLRTPDGHFMWFALKARPVVGSDGEVSRVVGTLTDVTEAKNAEGGAEEIINMYVLERLDGRVMAEGRTPGNEGCSHQRAIRIPPVRGFIHGAR
jgi:PAS domain S-box-containing protein